MTAAINDQTGAIELPNMTDTTTPNPDHFPFAEQDVAWWVVKRSDGVVCKYVLVDTPNTDTLAKTPTHYYTGDVKVVKPTQGNLGRWCAHTPKGLPLLHEGDVKLWVADCAGLRAVKNRFDYILDNGDVLRMGDIRRTLEGDVDLCAALDPYVPWVEPKLVKVDWPDREAPPLENGFFLEYAKLIKGNVVTACQGGHGRSGTSACALMMALIPDYTPFTAICHLRALHCPRAIESKVQHEWIGKFGEWLGRENDMEKVKDVLSFKETFLALDIPGAKKYQDQLRGMVGEKE